MTTNTAEEAAAEHFAVNLAALAREIAMDIFDLDKILEIHKLSFAEWERIAAMPRFQSMLADMLLEWRTATNTKERLRVRAQTGIETHLDQLINELSDPSIPLTQRVEAYKFLARLGELDGQIQGGSGGTGFHINLNIGELTKQVRVLQGPTIDGEVVK